MDVEEVSYNIYCIDLGGRVGEFFGVLFFQVLQMGVSNYLFFIVF